MRISFLLVSDKKDKAKEIINKYSYRYRNKGKHEFKNLSIIPPISAIFYINPSYELSEHFDDIHSSYINLIVNDLRNEPLRHATFSLLLIYLFTIRDYKKCISIAERQLKVLECCRSDYCDLKFQNNLRNIYSIISSCQDALDRDYINIPCNNNIEQLLSKIPFETLESGNSCNSCDSHQSDC